MIHSYEVTKPWVKLYFMEQKSEEWHQIRKGKATASNFNDILNGGMNRWYTLIDEINNGKRFAGNAATEWGVKHEPHAISLFELLHNCDVLQVGFVTNANLDGMGASPDGFIRSHSGVEVKCPFNPAVHAATRMSQQVPHEYMPQVQGTMMITEREEWMFLSYDPREIPENRLVQIPVARDEQYIDRLRDKCSKFVACLRGELTPEDALGIAAGAPFPKLF